MTYRKKFLIAFVALLIPLGSASAAQAANETVTVDSTLTPRKGRFFQDMNRPSNMALHVSVNAGAGQTLVDPLKFVRISFPAGMTLRPNNRVCPDRRLNSQSQLNSPAAVLNSCRNAVVGTGTATILLNRSVNAPLVDPILIAFNAGRTRRGQPRLKIYGYSQGTQVGILMTGVLRGRVLDIAIPVLSFDSATAEFDLAFPGPLLNRPDIGIRTRGRNPNYVQARCANGRHVIRAGFRLGTRNPSTGQDTGPTSTKFAPPVIKRCYGRPGRARLRARVVRKPRVVRSGRRGLFRVYVRNVGTAAARGLVVRAPRARTRVGHLAPGRGKVVNVRPVVRGRRVAKVRFVVRGKRVAPARTAVRVRVR